MKFKDLIKENSKFDQILYKKEFMIFKEMKDQHIKELEKEIEKLLKSKLNAKLIDITIDGNSIHSEVLFKDSENLEDDDVGEIDYYGYKFGEIVDKALKNIGLGGIKLYRDEEYLDPFDKTITIDFVICGYNKDYIKDLDKNFEYLKDFLEKLK